LRLALFVAGDVFLDPPDEKSFPARQGGFCKIGDGNDNYQLEKNHGASGLARTLVPAARFARRHSPPEAVAGPGCGSKDLHSLDGLANKLPSKT